MHRVNAVSRLILDKKGAVWNETALSVGFLDANYRFIPLGKHAIQSNALKFYNGRRLVDYAGRE